MSEVMMGFYEAVIEWHDADDDRVSFETSDPLTYDAAVKWLGERVILREFVENGEEWSVLPLKVDDQHRITDALDNSRWCYYWLRPSSQMALL